MILLAAGLAGFAVLTLEVLGVHWLAPWFGNSTLVWMNQIGVVLAAMALGGYLGGRRARATAEPAKLAGALLIGAGLLVATGILLLPFVARWLLPEQLPLTEAAGIFWGGSLTASLLFFVPPVLLLAMVSPLLVECRAKDRGAGRAAGELSAIGTLGSLLGVFGSTMIAIPVVGTQKTLAVVSGLLILAGALTLRSNPRAVALLIFPLFPFFLSDPAEFANLPVRPSEAVPNVLEVVESPYQRLRVLEFPNGERWLQMNEGLDSYQAVWFADSIWPGGYYDVFALAPLYAMFGTAADETAEFWVLGWGTGSLLGPVAAALRDRPWKAVGVELDPEVVRLGEAHMPLPRELAERTRVLVHGDARAYLRSAPADLDFILLDAYARQFEIPLHLATVEFFAEVKSHLRAGGVFGVNVGTAEDPHEENGFTAALRSTLGEVFGDNVVLHQVPYSRNVVIFARKEKSFPTLEELALTVPTGLPVAVGAALLGAQTLHGKPARPTSVFTDDRNPLALEQAKDWWLGS